MSDTLSSDPIDVSGLNPGAVLAALYNASQPLGMGALHYDPTPMTVDQAAEILAERNYFDYLKGRVMKVEIPTDGGTLDPRLYDRDNGVGAAARAIALLLVETKESAT